MENEPIEPLELLWDDLLSQDSARIERAFSSLDEQERQAVQSHLSRMSQEEDWLPQQRESAQKALSVLRSRFLNNP